MAGEAAAAPAAAPAPAAPADAAAPAAVARAKPAARVDAEAEFKREARAMREARKLRLVEAQTHSDDAAPTDQGTDASPAEVTQDDGAASEDSPDEARTPWAVKVKADLADAQARVQTFEQREAKWAEANRQVQWAHEDITDDLKHAQTYAAQLEQLLKSIGREVDPTSKAHFDQQRKIAKLERQIARGNGTTTEQQNAARHSTLIAEGQAMRDRLGAKYPELRGNPAKGSPAYDFLDVELARWARTGNFDGVDGRAAAWAAATRVNKPAPAAQPPRPRARPDSTTLAGQGAGSSARLPAAKGGQVYVSDKQILAEMSALRRQRGG